VPNRKTTLSELGTALGMLSFSDFTAAVRARDSVLVNVSEQAWQVLDPAALSADELQLASAAFANGLAFRRARSGLRDRHPILVEWMGSARSPGDEVAPVDLRVDHVFLVSCKYQSRVIFNPSPSHLFDRCLVGGDGHTSPDWFGVTAPDEYARLYDLLRERLPDQLPARVSEMQRVHRDVARDHLRPRAWPAALRDQYSSLARRVATESARRWRAAVDAHGERMLWRLLRMVSSPYFVLGTAPGDSIRLRIGTPWDFRQQFEFLRFEVTVPEKSGQARVDWGAVVLDRATTTTREVKGHVEVRWSHGRFNGPPEAKVYLDTPHHEIPGYFPLD
jgi:hypothetical protein